jgi:hypothetical protein
MRVRKAVCFVDEILLERGQPAMHPVTRAVAAAVITNPWLDRKATTGSLQSEVEKVAPELALLLTEYLRNALGGAAHIEGFGKGAIVGLDGELEHGAALLHTPYFGNLVRERLQGEAYIASADVRAIEGTTLVLPTVHKINGGLRTHFFTVPLTVADAPKPDEIVIAIAATTGPRPNARIGDRTTDRAVRLSEYAAHPIATRGS